MMMSLLSLAVLYNLYLDVCYNVNTISGVFS